MVDEARLAEVEARLALFLEEHGEWLERIEGLLGQALGRAEMLEAQMSGVIRYEEGLQRIVPRRWRPKWPRR